MTNVDHYNGAGAVGNFIRIYLSSFAYVSDIAVCQELGWCVKKMRLHFTLELFLLKSATVVSGFSVKTFSLKVFLAFCYYYDFFWILNLITINVCQMCCVVLSVSCSTAAWLCCRCIAMVIPDVSHTVYTVSGDKNIIQICPLCPY